MNRVYRDNKAPVHWSAFQELGAAVVPLINRGSTAGQTLIVFLQTVYMGFNTFVPPKILPGRLSVLPRIRNV